MEIIISILHKNFAAFIGKRLDDVEQQLRTGFAGAVVVLEPGQHVDESVNPSRLKVFIDEQRLITKIVNG